MYRILLDTNILLDSVIPNRPQHDEALALLKWCNGSGDYGFAAATSFNDAYYVLCRAYDEVIAREAAPRTFWAVGGCSRFRRGMRPFPSEQRTRLRRRARPCVRRAEWG